MYLNYAKITWNKQAVRAESGYIPGWRIKFANLIIECLTSKSNNHAHTFNRKEC